MKSLDDFIASALLKPAELLHEFTIADLERFVTEDANAVQWAYAKIQGGNHAA